MKIAKTLKIVVPINIFTSYIQILFILREYIVILGSSLTRNLKRLKFDKRLSVMEVVLSTYKIVNISYQLAD